MKRFTIIILVSLLSIIGYSQGLTQPENFKVEGVLSGPTIDTLDTRIDSLQTSIDSILNIISPVVESSTVYYVNNVGSDDADGLTRSTPWKTIAKVNASTFNPRDSILFNKGNEWREQLTIPSSGKEDSIITFASYGAGDMPVINASDLVTVWTDGGEAGTENSGDTEELSEDKTQVAGTYYCPITITSGGDLDSFMVYAYDSDANNVRCAIYTDDEGAPGDLVSNTTSSSVSPSTSGWFKLAVSSGATLSGSTDYWLAYQVDGNIKVVDQSIEGLTDQRKGTAVYADGFPSSYTANTGDGNWGGFYAVLTTTGTVADSVWEASVTSDPKIVIFDDTLGTEVLTLGAVDEEREWFWGSNVLYTYSEDTITSAVEAGARDYGIIDGGDETYITINGIEIKNARRRGIMFYGDVSDANITIDGCYIHHTREQGIYLTGYDNCIVENSRAEYTGSGIYLSPNSNYNIFRRDTSMYNIHYVNGVNTNGVYMDGHGFGVEECDSAIVEYCVAYHNGDGGFVVDNNVAENYDVILRYNKALGGVDGLYDCYGFAIARMGNGSIANVYYNVSYDYGRNSSANFFVNVDSSCTVNVYNNTFVNSSAVDGTVARWYDTEPNGNIDFRNNVIVSYRTSSTAYPLNNATSDEFTHSDYNLFYGPNLGLPFKLASTTYADVAAWNTGTGYDANSVEDNPDFTGETDFSLQSGSPAINAGTDIGLTQDINGNPIVGLPDIGAYEKQ